MMTHVQPPLGCSPSTCTQTTNQQKNVRLLISDLDKRCCLSNDLYEVQFITGESAFHKKTAVDRKSTYSSPLTACSQMSD